MIIKYISCDGVEVEERTVRLEVFQNCFRHDEYFMWCYRDEDNFFDVGIDELISITDEK